MFSRCSKHPVVAVATVDIQMFKMNGDPIDRDFSSEKLGGRRRSRRL